MGWVGIFVLVIGILAFIFGGAFFADGGYLAMIIGVIFVAVGVTLVITDDNAYGAKRHNQAVQQLRAEGWKIESDDVHIWKKKVQIECAEFDLYKLDDRWVVSADRSERLGGGRVFIFPDNGIGTFSQAALARACP